jgi:hypothetical protein
MADEKKTADFSAPPLLFAPTHDKLEKSADCSATTLVGTNTWQMRKIS